jgi:dihydrofolate reductase
MRKIIHFVHTSVDGFIEGPAGEFDWPAMGPELSDYSFGLNDRSDAFVYGRSVWEMMSSYWPDAGATSDHPHDRRFAPIWRDTQKYVLSSTLEEAGYGAQVIGDPAEFAKLKTEPGKDLLLMGGSAAMNALAALGLVDEWHIVVHPVVLGGGKALFPGPGERVGLRLVETRGFDGQSVLLRYEQAS